MSGRTTTIGVPADRRPQIERFLADEGLGWSVTAAGHGLINIVEPAGPGDECDRRTLHPSGRIDCSTALAMAEEHAVPAEAVGRLMNVLQIRIRRCQLGCFR